MCRSLAEQRLYYKKDNVVDLFRLNKESGLYVSSRDGSLHVNLDQYEDINERVLEDITKTESMLTFLIEQLDYKLEFGQLTLFGNNISYA